MNPSSSMNPEDYIEIPDEEIAAQLTIYVTEDGELMYNCDWQPGEGGLIGVASIFYQLLSDNLSEQIFEEIKTQCVSNNKEEDFMSISSLLKIHDTEDQMPIANEDVCVPPDRVMNI